MSAYRSILPRRRSDIRQTDFRDTYNLSVDEAEYGCVTERSLHWWNQHIPITPYEFYALFSRNFADDIRLDVNPTRDGIVIGLRSEKPGLFDGDVTFFTDPLKKYREPDSKFTVEPHMQGKGIGKSWIRSLVELSVVLGEDDFRFFAGSDNGAYTWARMGAALDMSSRSHDKRAEQSQRVIARAQSLRSFIDKDSYKVARQYAHMSSAADPSSLSDLQTLVDKKADCINECNSPIYHTLLKFFEKHPIGTTKAFSTASDEHVKMRDAFSHAAAKKSGVKFAHCLLVGTSWPAVIDFKNAKQMEKIGNYLGGWDSIQPI